MKTLLLSAGLVLAAFAAGAPAQANPCHVDDVDCMVDCLLDPDGCGIYQFEGGFEPCPAGQTGTVVVTGANQVPACVPAVTIESCEGRTIGVVVHVGDRPVSLCGVLA